MVGIYNMSTSIYCAKHAMEKRFERAMGQKQAPAPPPESKSFKKAKLHPINQEGKKILKEHKPHRDQGHMDSSVGNRRAMGKKPETPFQKSFVARKSAPTRNVSNDMTTTHSVPQRSRIAQSAATQGYIDGYHLKEDDVSMHNDAPLPPAADSSWEPSSPLQTTSYLPKKTEVRVTEQVDIPPTRSKQPSPNTTSPPSDHDLPIPRPKPQAVIRQASIAAAPLKQTPKQSYSIARKTDAEAITRPLRYDGSSSPSDVDSPALSLRHGCSDDLVNFEPLPEDLATTIEPENRTVTEVRSVESRPLAFAPTAALIGLSSSSLGIALSSKSQREVSSPLTNRPPSTSPSTSVYSADMSMSETEVQEIVNEVLDFEMLDSDSLATPESRIQPSLHPEHQIESSNVAREDPEATPPLETAQSPTPFQPIDQENLSMNVETDSVKIEDNEAGWQTTLPLNSLEYTRAQKAENFNPSELDSWLYKSPKISPDAQPSSRDLLDTQTWDEVNPKTTWPEVLSESWIEDKRKEIKARGGRKKNFGKILTRQLVQERTDNGWSLFQDREVQPLTVEAREAMRGVDELFGLKGVDDMVPAVRNGVLLMVDEEVEQPVRRGRPKSTVLRAYQVG